MAAPLVRLAVAQGRPRGVRGECRRALARVPALRLAVTWDRDRDLAGALAVDVRPTSAPLSEGQLVRVNYAVTFEFPERPPVTHRGTVEAGQAHVCIARATQIAKKALKPRGWSSLVVVLLEQVSGTTPEAA